MKNKNVIFITVAQFV